MTNFMSNQKVMNNRSRTIPHWESQDTSMHIEASSLNMLGLHNQIFSRKQFCKLGLDLVIDRHCFVAYERIIQKNPAAWARSCDTF